MRKIIYTAVLVCGVLWSVSGQDIHYSQFSYAPSTTNPALTGIFRGKLRAVSNSRQQWRTVPVNYLTFSASADVKLPNKNQNRTGFWAVGGNFNYDRAGSFALQNTNLNLSVSYTQRLAEKVFITAGAQPGLARRDFDLKPDLLFDSQYDRSLSAGNPALPNNENFQQSGNTFPDFSAGLNFRIQDFSNCEIVNTLDNRSWIDLGAGLFHLNRPDQAFDETDEARLPVRISPYIMANKQVNEIADVFLNLNFQFQGVYKEWLANVGGRVYLDKTPGYQAALELSCGYRFNDQLGDVVYPSIGLQYGDFFGSFSYDINISEFNVATRNRGGWEFTLRYTLGSICLDNYFCPLL
ncbi:PorP/SprF family type IX secretion system membrane protein [Phaeodactylibacter luteus]|uniref:PorP/SprF family type IX secretion system membrane protein n=1 Tax=Phaeodactylibacter luteus TaxID=1564516 RepID=UPI001479252D|nr:PorP/SprF family type IX secretion system membrane protein [Phaeodactylibacter luteus]